MPKNIKRKISEEQKQILLKNPNVEDVGKVSIYYTKAFREKAVELFYQGYTPKEIFKEAGFDLNIIGKSAPVICLGNWRFHDKKRKQRQENLINQNQSDEVKKILAENKYLKAENEFLKKLEALENQFR